jgi:predicted DNA binding protein
MRDRTRIPIFEARAVLEFLVRDDDCFIVAESERANCELVLNGLLAQSNGNLLQFLTVFEAKPVRVVTDALDRDDVADARVVCEQPEAGLVELILTGSCLSATVADSRAVPRLVSAARGVGRVIVDVPSGGDPQRVIELVRERHPDSELITRREHDVGPLFSDRLFEARVLGQLTERQYETLSTAYEMGYFDQPRQASAVECATALGISQSTFSQHLRVALRKVLDGMLAERGRETGERAERDS